MASAASDVERRVLVTGLVSLAAAVLALVAVFVPLPEDAIDAYAVPVRMIALPLALVAIAVAMRSRRLIVTHEVDRWWQPSLGGIILGGFALAAVVIGVIIPVASMPA